MPLLPRPFLPLLGFALCLACGSGKPLGGAPATTGTTEGAEGGGTKDKRAVVMRLFMEATEARLKGDLGRAAQLFQATLKADPQNAAAMFELAKMFDQAQHGQEALALAKRAVAADKEVIWYRFLLADLSTNHGDLNGAVKAYQDILAKWPERYEVYFGLANVLSMQNKIAEAQQVYRDLEKRFGPTEELVTREYDMLVTAGRIEEAGQLLERAIAADPDQTQYYGMLAEIYQERGESEKALALYEQALARDPDDSMMRISLAQYYYDNGRHEDAFQQLREAFADPDLDIDPKMQLLLGFYQLSEGEGKDSSSVDLVDQSHQLIEVLKKAHPQTGKPWSIEGDFLMREGKPTDAREAFRQALVYERDKYPIWNALLQLDLQLRDHIALHDEAAKAMELFPTQPELHLFDGIALSQLKRYDEAIETLIAGRDLVVDNKPLEGQFWSLLGDTYNEAKEHAKSDAAYDKALAINGDDIGVLNNYAYYLSERGERLEKAEQMSRKSNDLAPGQSTYLDTYAWILYKQGKYAEARTWQEKALNAGGASEGVLLEHYGDILYKLGDTSGALEQWKKAKSAGGASELIDRKVAEGHPVE